MYGMWHFYSAPYKPWSEGKNVYFLVGSFLLLITPATGHLVASFFAEICVCVSKWWGLAGPCLLHGREVLRAWCSRCRGFAANPGSIFWTPVSALGGGASKAMSSLIVPKEIQPVCPRGPQECRLKHGEWGWQGDSLQKHAADQTEEAMVSTSYENTIWFTDGGTTHKEVKAKCID